MKWTDVVALLIPLIKPLIVMGIVWLGKLASDALISFVKAQKLAYAHVLAGVIVRAIEDTHDNLEGSGKLKLAIEQLAQKIKLPTADLEDIVRSAYQSFIIPLDALKNEPATSSTPSTG